MSGFLVRFFVYLFLRRWKEIICLWSFMCFRGNWVLYLKVLKLRDRVLGDFKGFVFLLFIVFVKFFLVVGIVV